MDSIKPISLEDIPMPVLALVQPSTSQAVPCARYKTMAYATRSQAKPPLSKKNLDQSTVFMLNKERTSVIIKEARAGKAPAPKKLCTDGKKDTLKMRAPTAMSSSTSYIEISSDDESEETSDWLEKFIDAELASIMIESDLQLEEEFAPVESGDLPASLDELLSSEQNPSCAAPTAEEALASLDKPPSSQQDPSRAAPTVGAFPALDELLSSEQNPSCAAPRAEEALKNCSCSQQQLKMLRDLKRDFTSFARQQTKCMELVASVLLRMDKHGRRNDNPGPDTQNQNLTASHYPTLAALFKRPL